MGLRGGELQPEGHSDRTEGSSNPYRVKRRRNVLVSLYPGC